MQKPLMGFVFALSMVLGACSSGSGSDESAAGADPDTTSTTVAPSTSTTLDPLAAIEWVEHEAPEGCMCADGSEFTFWSRTADPEKVVLYFQGGGACFSAATCDPAAETYKTDASADEVTGEGGDAPEGIFDFTDPANPLREWSFVFVPYCTGDVHLGDNVNAYSDEIEINHVGFRNASAGLDHLASAFPDAAEVLVTGSSAGGVPSPLFGGLASDALPEAQITVLADASGAYPDNPPVNAAIGSFWGTFENVPDWPVNEGMTPENWSLPGLFVQAGLHDPDIRMARYDNAYDEVQKTFSALAEVGGDDQLVVIQGNEAQIEDAGVPVHSYIAPGEDHTILGRPDFYTLEVEGVPFIDWFSDYVAGDDVPDVLCVECGPGAPTTE